MNSKARCLAVIRGEPVDRPPVFPLLMFLAADRLGVPYREYATNGRVLVEAQQKVREQVGIENCAQAARQCLQIARGSRYMLSAGCEIPAAVPDAVFRAFCNTVIS